MNVGIIGVGRIAKKYINPIINDEKFNLIALCDINESVEQISVKYNLRYYSDYKEMLKQEKLDLVIITTPPKIHFEIAKYCILNGKNVILEKPAVLKIEELEVLIELSKENNVFFDVIFHWQYGNEVLYIQDKIKNFGEIKRIESTVYDPYTDINLYIKDEYIGLQGSWYDSGINCLSLLSCFVDVSKLILAGKDYIFDEKSGLDLYSNHKYKADDVDISIKIDWRYNSNHKYTNIYFHKDILYIDHSRQIILLNNKLLVDLDDGDRLENHYKNYFKLFDEKSINSTEFYNIHAVLLRDK